MTLQPPFDAMIPDERRGEFKEAVGAYAEEDDIGAFTPEMWGKTETPEEVIPPRGCMFDPPF